MTQNHYKSETDGNENDQDGIRSANLHINGACNYRCKFCFARNLIRETKSPEQWRPILEKLKFMGIDKINLAGGEPTMYPKFLEMCSLIKGLGFTVSVVTNGSLIDRQMIESMKGIVDWVGLSIDSPFNHVEKELGRQCEGVNHIANIINVADMAHDAGMNIKLNITVVRQSWNSDFTEIIKRTKPNRVKVFQVLKVEGENESTFDECSVTAEQWSSFVSRHENIVLENGEKIVFEGGNDMIDSYLMLDPVGRIMRNTGNKQSFSSFDELESFDNVVDRKKYHDRGALHRW